MTDHSKNDNEAVHLDEDQVRALHDIEKITRKNLNSMIREGLDMYIKVNKGEATYQIMPESTLSFMVFDKPYRKLPEK